MIDTCFSGIANHVFMLHIAQKHDVSCIFTAILLPISRCTIPKVNVRERFGAISSKMPTSWLHCDSFFEYTIMFTVAATLLKTGNDRQ